MEGDGGLGAGCVVEADQTGHVEVGEDVAVDHDEALVDAGLAGGEADGAGRVERLVLDGVVQVHAGAGAVGVGVGEGVGLVAERQDRFRHAVLAQVADDPLDHRHVADGQEVLRRGEGEGPEPGPEAADEDDRLHEPASDVVSVSVVVPSVVRALGGGSAVLGGARGLAEVLVELGVVGDVLGVDAEVGADVGEGIDARGRRQLGVGRGEGDGEGHPVVLEADGAEVLGDDPVGVVALGGGECGVPHGHLDDRVPLEAVAGVLALDVGLATRDAERVVGELVTAAQHGSGIGEPVHERGVLPGSCRGERVDVEQAVAVGVVAAVLGRHELGQVGDERIAHVDAVRGVPVVLEGEGCLERLGRPLVTGVHHQQGAEDHHGGERRGEEDVPFARSPSVAATGLRGPCDLLVGGGLAHSGTTLQGSRHRAVSDEELLGGPARGVLAGSFEAGVHHRAAPLGVVEDAVDLDGELGIVSVRDHRPRIGHQLGRGAGVGDHDRHAARHGLEHRMAEAAVDRRVDDHGGALEQRRAHGFGHVAQSDDPLLEVELLDRRLHLALGRALPAEEHQGGVLWRGARWRMARTATRCSSWGLVVAGSRTNWPMIPWRARRFWIGAGSAWGGSGHGTMAIDAGSRCRVWTRRSPTNADGTMTAFAWATARGTARRW